MIQDFYLVVNHNKLFCYFLFKLRSVLLCFVVGVHTIAYAYPNVKIVTAAVDPEVNDKFHIIPGIGKLYGTIKCGQRCPFLLEIGENVQRCFEGIIT